MARRGKFGRRRGGSTNLTALVHQLLREQRAAEDRVMFDAWQNGGQVDGKPVTDDRLLKYIKGRRDGFSTDDPMWDEWDNRLTQYGFSIGESKIQLAFQQGKVGAGAVAAFYRSQLKNIDKNSEFYRDVAGRAAQWAKATSAGARGRARASATKGLRDKLNNLIYEGAKYDAFEAALTAYARREGLITGDQKLTDAKASDLRAMFDRGIYNGTDRITFEDFRSAAVDKYKNLSQQVDIQVQLGNQGITARNKKSAFLNDTLVGLNTMDERSQYEAVRESYWDEIENAKGNPYAIALINDRYATALARIRDNASEVTSGYSANSSEFIGALTNEINAIRTGTTSGGQSVAEMFGEADDLAKAAKSAADLQLALRDIRSGKAYYGQTEPGGPMTVAPFPASAIEGVVPLSGALQPSISYIGGMPQTVYLMGQEVRSMVIVNTQDGTVLGTNGEPFSPAQLLALQESGEWEMATGARLGYIFQQPGQGPTYGVLDPTTGRMLFTKTNPWASPAIATDGGLVVITPKATRTQSATGWTYAPDNAAALVNPVTMDTADPLLTDGTVAPADILSIIQDGVPGTFYTPEDVAAYRARLERQQRETARATAGRYEGQSWNNLGIMGEVPADRYGPQGGGDLRSSILSGMDSIGDVTNRLFGSPDGKKDDLYTPPPPPTPEPPMPPALAGALVGAGATGVPTGAGAGALVGVGGANPTPVAGVGATIGAGGTDFDDDEPGNAQNID